jgi:hypothetical protein
MDDFDRYTTWLHQLCYIEIEDTKVTFI